MATISFTSFDARYLLIEGSHIRVHQSTAMGFDHAAEMLIEHFDVPAYDGSVFILGDYIFHPIEHFRALYPGARIVIYQLEQMVGSATWHPVERTIEHLRGADELWDYDPLNVVFLGWRDVRVDRVVPMLYTSSLRRVPLQDDPRIDVLFTGYINERRYRILRKLEQQTYNRVRFMWLLGVKGADLDAYIGDARIVLNMHAFEPWHRQEQTRIFYPLINSRMVVSETSERNWFGDCIIEADEDHLAETILYWLEDDRWRAFGLDAGERYRRMTERWLMSEETPDDVVDPVPAMGADIPGSAPDEDAKQADLREWGALLAGLRVYRPDSRKIRLGGDSDGGYVIPRMLLDHCSALISIGMRDDSRFEEDWFERTGKSVDMYDGQWPCARICDRWPDDVGASIRHTRQNAGNGEGMARLRDIVAGRDGALLKIDAEGAEYGLLSDCDLAHLNGLVLEFHDLHHGAMRAALAAILDRLSADFRLAHLHGNDCGPTITMPTEVAGEHVAFPSVLETVWVHRRILPETPELDDEPYPVLGLDESNNLQPRDFPLAWLNRW